MIPSAALEAEYSLCCVPNTRFTIVYGVATADGTAHTPTFRRVTR